MNLQMSIYMSIVVYAPALALSQVTGMNKYLSCTLICFVCIFYTTLGGMKAVLWTDTIQVKSSYLVHLDVRMSVYICRLFAEIPRTKIKYLPIVWGVFIMEIFLNRTKHIFALIEFYIQCWLLFLLSKILISILIVETFN